MLTEPKLAHVPGRGRPAVAPSWWRQRYRDFGRHLRGVAGPKRPLRGNAGGGGRQDSKNGDVVRRSQMILSRLPGNSSI